MLFAILCPSFPLLGALSLPTLHWLALLVLLLTVVILCFFPGNWLLESFAELWFGEQGLTPYILLSASSALSKNLNA